MMTLAVIGAPDSHRDPVFFWRVQIALTCFFVGFRTDFVTSVRVSVASAGVLALGAFGPRGPENPKGAPSPPPGYVTGAPLFYIDMFYHILSGWIHLHERTIFSHLGNA